MSDEEPTRPQAAAEFLKDQLGMIDERILNHRIQEFVENWSPDDAQDKARFTADLVTIVQTIHLRAVEQWARHIEAAAMRATSPIFVTKSEGL